VTLLKILNPEKIINNIAYHEEIVLYFFESTTMLQKLFGSKPTKDADDLRHTRALLEPDSYVFCLGGDKISLKCFHWKFLT
jgi:hypothetical protein